MDSQPDIQTVLAAYPHQFLPKQIDDLGPAGGFSGARFWRLWTDMGPICLRRWPREHPDQQRLDFIHAVLKNVARRGIEAIPAPILDGQGHSYVRNAGHFWELAPWLPGDADYHRNPTPERLRAAMHTLARFHVAASADRELGTPAQASPGIVSRLAQIDRLIQGDCQRLTASVRPGPWPELQARARRIIELFSKVAPQVRQGLHNARSLPVRLQPVIRDIWHDHVLFTGDEVTGMVDFGAMRTDSVMTDIARLLGSLVEDDRVGWNRGLDAYQETAPLSVDDLSLVRTFDASTVTMSGMNWLEWIYLDGRHFTQRETIMTRLDVTICRMEDLASGAPNLLFPG